MGHSEVEALGIIWIADLRIISTVSKDGQVRARLNQPTNKPKLGNSMELNRAFYLV